MLPKLQELHDRGRVIFFICTNNFDTIDPAVKRGGRIDHIVGIGPPDESARLKIVKDTIKELKSKKGWKLPSFFKQAQNRLIVKTEHFTRPEIQRAVRILANMKDNDSIEAAEKNADTIVERMKKSLTITEDVYEKYEKNNKEYSHPLIQGES